MKRFEGIDVLVLDYNKPEESEKCLRSIKEKFKFNHRVIFYSNGGLQRYAWDFYESGLIDVAIFNKKNEGLGVGTSDLWKIARSEYIINFQNDQYVAYEVGSGDIRNWIETLNKVEHIGAISLAGFPCGQGIYSDRAHFISRDLLLSLDNYEDGYPDGGCGPYWDGPESYNENFIQKRFKEKGLHVVSTNPPVVADNGKISIRENPDGSIWRHKTDTKEHWIDATKKPKKKHFYPEMNDEEWEKALSENFPIWDIDDKGYIPEQQKQHSFKYWD
jgi:hypothetical protein